MSQMLTYSPQHSDEAVAVSAQAGDMDAFAELVRRYQSPLQGFLRGRLGLAGQSEDLVQDVFLRAFQHLPHYNSRRRFRAWLFTIAYRVGVSWLRRRKLEQRYLQSAAAQPDTAMEPASQAAVREEHANLWNHARRILPDRQVALLWLYYVDELTVQEAAHALGMTVISAKVTLHRARKKMAGVLTLNSMDVMGRGGERSPPPVPPGTNGTGAQSGPSAADGRHYIYVRPLGAAASRLPDVKVLGARG